MTNGFKNLYEELLREKDRVLFETMNKAGKSVMDAGEFAGIVDNVAANLRLLPEMSRERPFVGIRIKNSYLLYAAAFGALKAGASILMLDAGSTAGSAEELLEEVEAGLLVTDRGIELSDDRVRIINAADLTESRDEAGAENWGEIMAFATSGTTGKSKIIAYGGDEIYRQVSRTAGWFKETPRIRELLGESRADQERVMSILPMHHIFGCLCPLILLHYGFRILFPKNDAISTIISAIRSERVWGCLSVPMFWQTIRNILSSRCGCFNSEAVRSVLGDNFKFCLTGGTYADLELRKQFLDAGLAFTLGFGMTETGCCTMHFMDQDHVSSEGCLYQWYDAVVRDEEGRLSETGTGELLIKSDVIFRGYIKNGKLLEREDDGNGYYPTGDIFRKQGSRIEFVGRCKNIIVNASGENIYIEELEQSFSPLTQYGVIYGIIGMDDEPLLVVKLTSDAPADKISEKISEIVKTLPVYQRPRKAVLTKGELPMTAKGEIKKVSVTRTMLSGESNIEIVFKNSK